MIRQCLSEAEYQQLLTDSRDKPVLLMKHSTRCPISAAAHGEFLRFAAALPDVECWEVLVIEQRPLSQAIAEQSGITHQSPQVILFRGGVPVWHAAHYGITERALLDLVDNDANTGENAEYDEG